MVDYTGLPTITLILSDSSRKILTKLDDHIVLMSPSDNLRDYRGLAGLLKFSKGDISKFGKDAHPTMRILESWENRPDAQASLKKLFRFLQAMDRHDIIQDLLPTLSFELEIVPRDDWGARANLMVNPIAKPVRHIIICHTEGSQCDTKYDCSAKMKSMQQYHMSPPRGWSDIGYNFVIGGDGRVYEGVGWNRGGIHTRKWNNVSYGIAFIGNYMTVKPKSNMLRAAILLIARGIELGVIAEDHWVHGARNASPGNDSPGDELYAIIRRWSRFKGDLSEFETAIK